MALRRLETQGVVETPRRRIRWGLHGEMAAFDEDVEFVSESGPYLQLDENDPNVTTDGKYAYIEEDEGE